MVEKRKSIRRLAEGVYGPVELLKDESSGQLITSHSIERLKIKRKDYAWLSTFPKLIGDHSNLVGICTIHQTEEGLKWEQEYFRFGNLLDYIPDHCGLDETRAKMCVSQLVSAIEFMHDRLLVHGDIKAENVLVCDPEMRAVKLSGFCHTRKEGDITSKDRDNIPYMPPEVVHKLPIEGFAAHRSQDAWSFGVLMFCIFSGFFPWMEAEKATDTDYRRYYKWHKHHHIHLSSTWDKFSKRFLKLYRKLVHPKSLKRCPVTRVEKYTKYSWMRSGDDEELDFVEDVRSSGYTAEEGTSASSDSDECITTKLGTMGVSTNGARNWRKLRTAMWVSSTAESEH